MAIPIKANGTMGKKMVLAFLSGRITHDIKANGKMTWLMASEFFIIAKITSIRAIGKMIRHMEKGISSLSRIYKN